MTTRQEQQGVGLSIRVSPRGLIFLYKITTKQRMDVPLLSPRLKLQSVLLIHKLTGCVQAEAHLRSKLHTDTITTMHYQAIFANHPTIKIADSSDVWVTSAFNSNNGQKYRAGRRECYEAMVRKVLKKPVGPLTADFDQFHRKVGKLGGENGYRGMVTSVLQRPANKILEEDFLLFQQGYTAAMLASMNCCD